MERVTNKQGWGRERVLERVIRKGYVEIGLPHTRQEVLDALFGRRFCEWTSPHRRKHLSAPVLVRDRDHCIHDACMQAAETRDSTHDNLTASVIGECTRVYLPA